MENITINPCKAILSLIFFLFEYLIHFTGPLLNAHGKT